MRSLAPHVFQENVSSCIVPVGPVAHIVHIFRLVVRGHVSSLLLVRIRRQNIILQSLLARFFGE